jgi:hypothetical protein
MIDAAISGSTTGVTWSGGAGTFLPNANTINVVYRPDVSETGSTVELYITSDDPPGTCIASVDTVEITFELAPIADAGSDIVTCEGDGAVTITTASVGGGATFPPSYWQVINGTGTLTDSLTLSPTYTPGIGEIGVATLQLTASSGGTCPDDVDFADIVINRDVVVDAGSNKQACGNSQVPLFDSGISGGTTGVTWSGGSGSFIPNDRTLNAIYFPDPSETGTTITLYLESDDPPGPCGPVIDSVQITFEVPAGVYAGPDTVICEGSTVLLDKATANAQAGTVTWSTSGSGIFLPDENTLNAEYVPDPSEIGTTVQLVLTSSDPAGVCPAVSDVISVTINKAPEAFAGADTTVCEGSSVLINDALIGGSASTLTWSGGLGSYSPNANTLNVIYTPDLSEIGTTVTLFLQTNDPAGPCIAAIDSIDITVNVAPDVFAGTDMTVCEGTSIALNSATSTSAFVTWSGGLGSFVPDASTLNATYVPDPSEIGSTVILTLASEDPPGPCNASTDDIRITINRAPTIVAGSDTTICEGTSILLEDAIIGGSATSVTWTGGVGAFSPNRSTLNAIYTPAASESGGSVTLTVTTNDPAGPCPAASDDIVINVNVAPTVDAGNNETACEGEIIDLSGASIGGSTTSIKWSGGSGTFLPNDSTLAALYLPADDEIGQTITLRLTSNDPPGPCGAVFDEIQVTINKSPEVFAGIDQQICEGSQILIGDATIGGSTTSVTWSGGAGTFLPNPNTLNVTYVPTAGEIGTIVTLTITTNDPPGPCQSVSDEVDIQIDEAPQINAGSDQVLCEGDTAVLFDATIGGSTTSVKWTGGSGTFLPNDSTLNAAYYPASGEIGTTVVLTLTSNTPTGVCTATADQVNLSFNRAPVVSAGSDQTICETSDAFLNGTISGSALTATWSTLGDGTFSFVGDLNATYTPGTADRSTGGVLLVLTSNDPSGPCQADIDTVSVQVDQAAFAIAGTYENICYGDTLFLNGAIAGAATSATWNGGLGIFGSRDSLSTYYVPSKPEEGRLVTLTLITDNPPNVCPANVDRVDFEVYQLPFVNFTPRFDSIAVTESPVVLTGTPVEDSIFFGPGVVGNTFDPELAGPGPTFIGYEYTDALGCTNTTVQNVLVIDKPPLDLADPEPYCVNEPFNAGKTLPRGSVEGQFIVEDEWRGSPFLSLPDGSGNQIFRYNPGEGGSGVGQFSVLYYARTNLGVEYFIPRTITVFPAPTADLEQLTTCVSDSIRVRDLSEVDNGVLPGNAVVDWDWRLLNASLAGIIGENGRDSLAIYYNRYGRDTVRLEVTTNNNCSRVITREILIGGVPEAAFEWEDVAEGSETIFDVKTKMPNDDPTGEKGFSDVVWDFGDGSAIDSGGVSDNYSDKRHLFPGVDTYNVTLYLKTILGCEDFTTIPVTILEKISDFPSLITFDGSEPRSIHIGAGLDSLSSWRWAHPESRTIKPYDADTANKAWITLAIPDSITFYNNEKSYVLLPYYDLANLQKPMVSLKYWVHAEDQRDGAVMQVKVTSGSGGDNLWKALNDLSSSNPNNRLGVNWYNNGVPLSQPGVIDPLDSNQFFWGWTDTATYWRTARFPLDEYIGKTVQFRIAFSSDAGNVDPVDGFAFDNFFVGERERLVLLEQFTNSTMPDSELYTMIDDNAIDLNYLEFHTQPDEIYLANPGPTNTRGSVYNFDMVPRSFLSGFYSFDESAGNGLMDYHIVNAAMDDPVVEISTDTAAENNQIYLTITVRALDTLHSQKLLHTAVIEKEVDASGEALRNIVRAMVPDPAGALLNPMLPGEEVVIEHIFDINDITLSADPDLAAVVFVQEPPYLSASDNWIYQSHYVDLPDVSPRIITGLEDALIKNLRFGLYPNPAKYHTELRFNAELVTDLHWKIVDLRGVELLSGTLVAGQEVYDLNISGLPNGVFNVLLGDESSLLSTRKLIILR